MKNTMLDLNDHLFAALERLSDEELTGEQLQEEIKRSDAIRGIAHEIVSNAGTVLKAERMRQDGARVPKILESNTAKKEHPVLMFKEGRV